MEDTTPFQNKNQNTTSLGTNANYIVHDYLNHIHPTAIIGKNVTLGKNNYIGAFCVITGYTKIGDGNRFEAFCSIGTEPESKNYFGKPNKGLVIGNNNVIREYVTINAGCERTTVLNNNIIMLRGSHCGHDSIISDDCTISCNALIGGHSFIGKGANLGLGAILHQFSKIGSYSMVGMGTIVTKKSTINCFGTYVGSPAKYIAENDHQKKNFDYNQVLDICKEFETEAK